MSASEHEILYTPSEWSKRMKSDEILTHFFALARDVTTQARKTTACDLDISYGSTERTKYDVYGTNLPKDAPVFIFIHGGYWQELSKDMTVFAVPVLVANGIKVVMVGYDLCPNVKLTDIVSQIKTAIEHILKSVLISESRCIWIAGHSAGAHLAASLLHDNVWMERMIQTGYAKLLRGFMLIGGVYRLEPLLFTSFNDNLQLTAEEIRNFSFANLEVKHNETVRGVKVIVTVGECDSPVFIDESRKYAQNLTTVVDHMEYILLRDNVDHFDIVENLLNPNFYLTKLILQNMSAVHCATWN